MTNAILREKTQTENPRIRFDEGEDTSARPRRKSLLGKMTKILPVLVLMPLVTLAATEKVDGITWTYKVSDGQASIGSGSRDIFSSPAVPKTTTGAIVIPSTLGGCPVTSIGLIAFRNCRGLNVVYVDKGDANRVKGLFDWPGSVTFVEGVLPTAEEKPQER